MRPTDPSLATATDRVRILGAAMIGGVLVFCLFAIFAARGRESGIPATVAWLIAAAALPPLAFSFLLDGSSARKRILALALREASGLFGAVVTLLTGDPAWAVGLGAAAVVALVAGLPRPGELTSA